jgi:hypothetical protein
MNGWPLLEDKELKMMFKIPTNNTGEVHVHSSHPLGVFVDLREGSKFRHFRRFISKGKFASFLRV